ncbi:MAG: hypothetical protein ABI175_17750 [Polyangiales bacterium]
MKIALACVLLAAACTPEIDAYKPLDVKAARDLDILFVIDDSSNRGSYDEMASQLDVLQARLADVDGQLPSLHVGVVTTDLGTSSTKDALPGWTTGNCTGFGKAGQLQTFDGQPGGGYLEDLRDASGGRMRNFTSNDLAGELDRLTNPSNLGIGCEYEQPLEAMRKALDPEINPGFMRDGALLSVVFLTAEDDCSAQRSAVMDPTNTTLGAPTHFRCTSQGVICDPDDPWREGDHANCRPREGSPVMVDVSEYKTFLEAAKPDKRDVVVSAVAGSRDTFKVRNVGSPVLQPSCTGPGGTAYPAVRIGSLVDSFGGAFVDACTQESAYQRITKPLLDRQRSCLPSLLASEREGCTVLEIVGDTETELTECATGAAGPCWYSYADAAACPDGDNLGIAVRRGAGVAPSGARLEARCFVP